eukprot:325506-Prorocentrum_minimum.AAC.1
MSHGDRPRDDNFGVNGVNLVSFHQDVPPRFAKTHSRAFVARGPCKFRNLLTPGPRPPDPGRLDPRTPNEVEILV